MSNRGAAQRKEHDMLMTPEAETVDRWHFHHGRYFEHRRRAEDHATALKDLAPEYQAIIRRAQHDYDLEHALDELAEAAYVAAKDEGTHDV